MFIPHKYDKGLQPWEYYPAAAGSYKVGQLLKMDDGKLSAIGAAQTSSPSYLCMGQQTVEDGALLPVIRVHRGVILETTLSADAADAKIGSKLQVSAGGLQVDAAAVGSFEVTDIEDTSSGSKVQGRFL